MRKEPHINTYLDKLKKVYAIHFNGEYVVISHTKLHILRPDGTLVACRSDLRHAGRITFLSGNRMLLCSSKAVFHMIDLTTGEDIWTAPYTKTNLNISEIALSPDEVFAYTYDARKGTNFISRLFLTTQEHEVDSQDMYYDVGATREILCDEEGIPCLLKTLTETIGGKRVDQAGVRMHDYDGIAPGGTTTWKTKWSFYGRSAIAFFGSTDRVVTSDLHVYNPATGEDFNLLENEREHALPEECIGQGCLIGNEYWLGTENGMARKPFPAFEEIPPREEINHFAKFTSGFYAKHPELW